MENKNIFENAYFGKPFMTRDGRRAVYLGGTMCWIEGRDCETEYSRSGIFGEGEHSCDIISEWKEPINEKELDNLAKSYDIPIMGDGCGYSDEEWDEVQYLVEEAYKTGYRKALER